MKAALGRFGIDAGLLLVRIFIGGCLLIHGAGKIGDIGKFAGGLQAMNMPMPLASAWAAALAEALGGACLIVGFMTRVAVLPAAFTLFVGAVTAHGANGYLITNDPPGYEYALNLGVIVMSFALTGAGRYSIDGRRMTLRQIKPQSSSRH
jgi:putative oxidoreductase